MSEQQRADGLDDLVEARAGRRSALDAPAAWDLRRLAEAAERLDASWDSQAPVDRDAVWSRIAPELARPRRATWWSRLAGGLPSLGAIPRRAAAVTALVAVLLAAVLVPGQSSSAAFLDDVARLTAATERALADSELTAEEQHQLEVLSTRLIERLRDNPSALDELPAQRIEEVSTKLAGVERALERHAAARPANTPAAVPASTAEAGDTAPQPATAGPRTKPRRLRNRSRPCGRRSTMHAHREVSARPAPRGR